MGKKNIEIIPGNGNIEISPAEDHISDMIGSKKTRKEEIVIPKVKKENK
jgi:hypothetical protein